MLGILLGIFCDSCLLYHQEISWDLKLELMNYSFRNHQSHTFEELLLYLPDLSHSNITPSHSPYKYTGLVYLLIGFGFGLNKVCSQHLEDNTVVKEAQMNEGFKSCISEQTCYDYNNCL